MSVSGLTVKLATKNADFNNIKTFYYNWIKARHPTWDNMADVSSIIDLNKNSGANVFVCNDSLGATRFFGLGTPDYRRRIVVDGVRPTTYDPTFYSDKFTVKDEQKLITITYLFMWRFWLNNGLQKIESSVTLPPEVEPAMKIKNILGTTGIIYKDPDDVAPRKVGFKEYRYRGTIEDNDDLWISGYTKTKDQKWQVWLVYEDIAGMLESLGNESFRPPWFDKQWF